MREIGWNRLGRNPFVHRCRPGSGADEGALRTVTADIDRHQPRQSIACADAAALATQGAASIDAPGFQEGAGPGGKSGCRAARPMNESYSTGTNASLNALNRPTSA